MDGVHILLGYDPVVFVFGPGCGSEGVLAFVSCLLNEGVMPAQFASFCGLFSHDSCFPEHREERVRWDEYLGHEIVRLRIIVRARPRLCFRVQSRSDVWWDLVGAWFPWHCRMTASLGAEEPWRGSRVGLAGCGVPVNASQCDLYLF